jgi:uncharacterized protein YcbK (DUF882 family)
VRLSPHFDTQEFACHDGTPVPRHAYDDLRRLAELYLEPLRERFGPVTILSGYRTPAYNREVGGAPASFHVYSQGRWGAAADVRARRGEPRTWHRYLASLDPGGLGLYPHHVHVDNRAGHARW